MEEIPKEYGKKQTIDYFLKWMDDNLTMDNEMMESSDSVSNMTEAFEKITLRDAHHVWLMERLLQQDIARYFKIVQ